MQLSCFRQTDELPDLIINDYSFQNAPIPLITTHCSLFIRSTAEDMRRNSDTCWLTEDRRFKGNGKQKLRHLEEAAIQGT